MKKGVLKNFAKFTGKHFCQTFFFNKVAGGPCNFIKKETLAQVFSYEFCEISTQCMCFPVKFANFLEHLFNRTSPADILIPTPK